MDVARERIAVIGGGIAGLACARGLLDTGWEVDVFDKARKAGGRLSTRRAGDLRFDHGAPFFTVQDPNFRALVERWEAEGIVAPWMGAMVQFGEGPEHPDTHKMRYVGAPTMSAIPRAMAQGVNVHAGVRITEVSRVPSGFVLGDSEGRSRRAYRWVVVATPAQQAVKLLRASRQLSAAAERADMRPCLTAMVAFDRPLPLELAAAYTSEGPLELITRQNSKPGRADQEAWVLHANARFSAAHIDSAPEGWTPKLLEAFAVAADVTLPETTHVSGHRWRYACARPRSPGDQGRGFLLDAEAGLAACGDWCMGPRVEDAWRSGRALSLQLIAAVHARRANGTLSQSSQSSRPPWA